MNVAFADKGFLRSNNRQNLTRAQLFWSDISTDCVPNKRNNNFSAISNALENRSKMTGVSILQKKTLSQMLIIEATPQN